MPLCTSVLLHHLEAVNHPDSPTAICLSRLQIINEVMRLATFPIPKKAPSTLVKTEPVIYS